MNYRRAYTLYKRGSYWYYRVWSADGRRVSKTTGMTSKGAARNYCDGLLQSGALLKDSRTFGVYAAGFFDEGSVYVKTNGLKRKSIRTYQTALKCHIMPYWERVKLEDITYSRVMQFRMTLQDGGMAARSVNITVAVLKIILSVALRDNLIQRSPFVGYKTLSVPHTADAFTIDELKRALGMIEHKAVRNTVLLLALTGMRISEGLGVTGADVAEADGIAHIHLARQLQREGYAALKRGGSRDIPIIAELRAASEAQKPSHDMMYKHTRAAFDAVSGGRAQPLTMHSLRHFFITSAKSCGVNPGKVETIAGHSLKGMEAVYTNYKLADLTDILSWQRKTYAALTE